MGTLRPLLLALVVCLAVVPVRPATAQPAAPASTPVPLTLAQAIEQALARNRDLVVSRRELEISRGRLRQARVYPLNPELTLEGDAGRANGRGEDTDRRGVGGGSIGISQAIEVRGQRGLRVRGAESEVARSEWLLRNGKRQVVADTTRAFSDLLVAQERLGLARDAVALATRLKETADALVEAGSVPELDALRAEVELRRASNRVTLDTAAVITAIRSLAFLTGTPTQVDLRASGPDAGRQGEGRPAAGGAVRHGRRGRRWRQRRARAGERDGRHCHGRSEHGPGAGDRRRRADGR